MRADIESFQVHEAGSDDKYYDGVALFWKIAEVVDPDNGHLVENVRKEIKAINVKDFGYSVSKMLAHFKRLIKRLGELGGTYANDEKFLDLWEMLGTMKEERFTRYVEDSKDDYRKTPRATRRTFEWYITDMTAKEVAMKSEGKWNKASRSEELMLALVNYVEQSSKNSKKTENGKTDKQSKNKSKSSDENDKTRLTDEEKAKRKESKIPDWKKQPPSDDDEKTKDVEDRTYHWCGKCRGGKGMWALHSEKDHKDNFKPPSNSTKSDEKKDDDSKKKSTNDDSSVQVSKDLLKNAKAYLAQFNDESDFQ